MLGFRIHRIRTLGIILPPMYQLNLIAIEIGLPLAAVFYLLLAISRVLIQLMKRRPIVSTASLNTLIPPATMAAVGD